MKLYVLYLNNHATALCEEASGVRIALEHAFEEKLSEFSNQLEWTRSHYIIAENYAASHMNSYKVLEIDTEASNVSLRGINFYGYQNYQFPDGTADVTDQFFTLENTRYEGLSKVFADVVKTGIKSHGLTVIVDPQLTGAAIRQPEEYEALVGTFARVKATTDINGYGYATLFFAPESLSNYRVETQMVDGRRLIWAS